MDERDPLIGRVVGNKFRILDLVGQGSMAVVYRAHHAELDKVVAVKLLQVAKCPAHFPARFIREARTASRFDHPHSVSIYDCGHDGKDLLYIAMEYIDGEELEAVIEREAPMELARIAELMTQVLAALTAAHEVGVIHRDIKPANIMITRRQNDDGDVRDFVKVCDFGMAKFEDVDPDQFVTQRGAIVGTPQYMSPEQAGGDDIDERTDIYSCGVILYEMACGRLPFEAKSLAALLVKQMSDPMPPPSRFVPEIHPELEFLIMWACAKDRAKRCPSGRDLRNALRGLGRRAGPSEFKTDLDVRFFDAPSKQENRTSSALSTTPDTKPPTRPAPKFSIPEAETERMDVEAVMAKVPSPLVTGSEETLDELDALDSSGAPIDPAEHPTPRSMPKPESSSKTDGPSAPDATSRKE